MISEQRVVRLAKGRLTTWCPDMWDGNVRIAPSWHTPLKDATRPTLKDAQENLQLSKILGSDNGHRFLIGQCYSLNCDKRGIPFMACVRCGKWATVRTKGLVDKPCGKKQQGGKNALKAISKGHLPDRFKSNIEFVASLMADASLRVT